MVPLSSRSTAPAAATDQSPTRRATFSYALPVPGVYRHADLGQQLARADDGLVRAEVELAHRDLAVAVPAADDRGRAHRGEHRGQVLGRVGLAQRPADGAPQADDRVRHDPFGVMEDREVLARCGGVEQVRVPGQRADAELAAVCLM